MAAPGRAPAPARSTRGVQVERPALAGLGEVQPSCRRRAPRRERWIGQARRELARGGAPESLLARRSRADRRSVYVRSTSDLRPIYVCDRRARRPRHLVGPGPSSPGRTWPSSPGGPPPPRPAHAPLPVAPVASAQLDRNKVRGLVRRPLSLRPRSRQPGDIARTCLKRRTQSWPLHPLHVGCAPARLGTRRAFKELWNGLL